MITDIATQQKWNKLAPALDLMSGRGAEQRWQPYKRQLFGNMKGKVLFLALGTGLDIASFPPNRDITAIDISPTMLRLAEPRVAAYPGSLTAKLMDVHAMEFADGTFDQVFTSCTFCSVPNPVGALAALRRVLKPGGELFMFEHTGSHYFPLSAMMKLMTLLTSRFGPSMDRETVKNVEMAGFELLEVENVFLDVVKIIKARAPG